MKTVLLTIIFFTFIYSISFANIIKVPADIDSIQGGIDLANNGDTVLVQPGTYVENINFNGKNIVVGSLTLTTGDTSYISQTVIDGNQNGSVVKFENGEDSTTVLCGFTLTKGNSAINSGGGGIYIMNSSPIVSDMLIKNNKAVTYGSDGGGGIYLNNSNTKISNATISSNIGYWEDAFLPLNFGAGGGILCENSNLTLTNIKIINNVSVSGGGIFCRNSDIVLINAIVSENSTLWTQGGTGGSGITINNSNATLANVIVSKNIADINGGGIYCISSDLSLSNVTIKENSANYGGGMYFEANSNPSFDPVNLCNIYLNTANELGNDLFAESDSIISVYVDTFTVLVPVSIHAYPLNKFTFDIQNAVITNISENPISLTNFTLNQNYPNPFNPTTNIEFSIPKSEFVTLKVYNVLGEEVATMVSERLNVGSYSYDWDASNLASGVYLYSLEAGEFVKTRKMILMH
jgi:hypothetical protein